MKKLSSREKLVREKLLAMMDRCRHCAATLQGEIDRGVAIRQSIESKQARVDILQSHASELEEIVSRNLGGYP